MTLLNGISAFGALYKIYLIGSFLAVFLTYPPGVAYSGSAVEDSEMSTGAVELSAKSDERNRAISCAPTKPDMLGPFYEPGAPVRTDVGDGYQLVGTVRSAKNCSPIEGARVELWLAGPDGKYDDAHRATVVSKESGQYKLESNFPPSYQNRPSHIHVRVTAEGHKTLVTQHYPNAGERNGTFDLVLVPEKT